MAKPKFDPLLDEVPPPAEASALAALHLGTANGDQQKIAMDWIINRACRSFASAFNADPIISAFLQGRQQAGRIIMNAMRTSAKGAQAVVDLNNQGNEA